MQRSVSSTLSVGLVLTASAVARANLADSVASYTPGSFTSVPSYASLTTPSSAIGPIDGDTGGGYALNPFDPPYEASQVVAIGAGGELTLHMAGPVTTGVAALGVFSNAGIDDVSTDGSGVAGNPAQTLDEAFGETDPEAIVEVSPDNVNADFVALNGGNPILFTDPTNAYLDGEDSEYYEPLGTELADQFQPFTGTLSSFNGLDFDQIKSLLDGSAGGNWLDLSGTGYSQINYVRFVVPGDATYGMIVDSVAGVPEPTVLLPLALLGVATLRRRRSRRNAAI